MHQLAILIGHINLLHMLNFRILAVAQKLHNYCLLTLMIVHVTILPSEETDMKFKFPSKLFFCQETYKNRKRHQRS